MVLKLTFSAFLYVSFWPRLYIFDAEEQIRCYRAIYNVRWGEDQPHELPVLTEPKSNLLETILSVFPPLPLPDSFRFRLFGPAAFTPGPEEAGSTFPSSSSNGLEDCADCGLGSFEG